MAARLTFKDRIANAYYAKRYQFYKKFCKRKLKDSSPLQKSGWELTFHDDFNEVSWSKKSSDTWRKWCIGEHWGHFNPNGTRRSYWVEPILNDDSTITLRTEYKPHTFYKKAGSNYWYWGKPKDPVEELEVPFAAGGLSSNPSFRQQYGRWECRCRVPKYNGCKAAYWMWGSTWPPEIDVFESDTSDSQQVNLHYGVSGEPSHSSMRAVDTKSLRPGHWQEFTLIWSKDKIEMYTDGIKIFRYTNKDVLKWYNADNSKMWVVLTQYVIKSWFKETDTSEFDVDYVRVYKNI